MRRRAGELIESDPVTETKRIQTFADAVLKGWTRWQKKKEYNKKRRQNVFLNITCARRSREGLRNVSKSHSMAMSPLIPEEEPQTEPRLRVERREWQGELFYVRHCFYL